MFIFWGADYYCFYNDAYARSIGPEKHDAMLGGRAVDHWFEAWDLIGPELDYVTSGRGATWHENELVPIVRHGRLQDVFWTYGYSPIDEPSAPSGVGGVMVICAETTTQVLADRRHAFLVGFDDALRRLSEASAIVATGTELLGRQLKASRVGFGHVQPDDETIVVETNYVDGVAPLLGTFTLDSFGAQNIFLPRSGTTLARDDVTLEASDDRDSWAAIQTRAFVSVPLVREGRLRASLFVNDRRPRAWTRDEILLVEAVASRLFDSLDRARSEAQLRFATRRFNLALNRSHIVLFSQDLELRYTWIHNPALGYTAEEVIGKRDVDLFPHSGDADRLQRLKREVLIRGESTREEIRLHTPEGTPRHYDLQIDPIRDDEGRIEGVLCSAIDVTERKSSEVRLREAGSRKDVFLAVLSHELRSPLAPIQTAGELLAFPDLTPDRVQWVHQVIRRQTRRMAHLLDDLLDVGTISQGKLTLKIQRVTLISIIDAAIEAARPLIDRKHQRLSVELPSESLMLEVDPNRLCQVLANLLTNAAKYTDDSGLIQLRCIIDNNMVRLSVTDAGIGIAPDDLERIFDIFSQIDPTAPRSDGGLGIGLALVRGLVELHRGTVEAQSAGLGEGSTFTVTLPHTENVLDLRAGSERITPTVTGCRILVADDNADAAEALALLLSMDGHHVRVARSGAEALTIAQVFRPEVALLDIGMPGMSGHDVAKDLRREAWAADLYLVALTGWGHDTDRQQSAAAGFNWHLTKPVDADTLTDLLLNRPGPFCEARAGLSTPKSASP